MNGYDKKAVGERIKLRRKALGLSQENFAERIGRVPKFCADIERGQAGMSIQTMLTICALLKISPNDLLLGETNRAAPNELNLIVSALKQCTEQQRQDAYSLLKLFLIATR